MYFEFSFTRRLAFTRRLSMRSGDTFLVETCFLRELVLALTPTPDEHMLFLTGPMLRRLRVVSRRAPQAPLERQSVVFVRSSALAVAQALIPIIEQGAELHMIAHSHPGGGPSATFPSGTDTACLGKLQRAGSPAIGLIVTRDGHARFFTVHRPFQIIVAGAGVTKLDDHLFHLHENDPNESTPSSRPTVRNHAPPRTRRWF